MSKDTAFNGETTPRHTFLCSDSQCLSPGDPIILCAKHGSPITWKSFIGFTPFFGITLSPIGWNAINFWLYPPPQLKSPSPKLWAHLPVNKKVYLYQYLYIAKWTFCAQQFFFSAKNSKVTIIKTKSATIAFFLLLSFFSLFLFLLSSSFVTLIFRASRVKETCLLTPLHSNGSHCKFR